MVAETVGLSPSNRRVALARDTAINVIGTPRRRGSAEGPSDYSNVYLFRDVAFIIGLKLKSCEGCEPHAPPLILSHSLLNNPRPIWNFSAVF